MKGAVIALILLGILAVAAWWEVFKFKDCKNVGHSTLYCISKLGD